MRKLIVVLLLCGTALGQGARIGSEGSPNMSTASVVGTTVLTPVVSSTFQVCNYPANGVPCSNKATTYTDQTLTTTCSTSTQLVLAGTSSCVAASDSLGNWGAFVAAGDYDVTYTDSTGTSHGPYRFSAGGGTAVSKRPYVDVIRDCGAKGYPTDDGATIQTCINNNPGRTIFFPATTSAACSVTPSYKSTQMLTLNGGTGNSGSMLLGDHSANQEGSCIKFSAGTSALVLIPATCHNCGVQNMQFYGSDVAVGATNGIEIRGGQGFVRESHVALVGGNAVWINGAGASGYIADGWEIRNSFIGGFTRGLYAQGSDANVGRAIGNDLNAGTGCTAVVENNSTFINWYIGNHIEGAPATCPSILDTAGNSYWSNYVEGAQGAEVYKGTGSYVVSGWHGSLIDWVNSQYPLVEGYIGSAVPGGTNRGYRSYLEVYNGQDALQTVYTRSGLTAEAGNKFPVFRKFGNISGDWASLYFLPGSPASFGLYDEVNSVWRVRPYIGTVGAAVSTEVSSIGTGNVLLNYPSGSGTGGTLFGNGAGAVVASVNSSGLGTFNGGVTTPLQLTSTVATGTAPFVVSSTTNVANLNASSLGGATFAAPGAIGGGTPAAGSFTTLTGATLNSTTNCSSSASPAVCGAAAAGSVAIANPASTIQVNTTAVTSNSQIFVMEDSSLGTKLGVTCNTTAGRTYQVTARTAATNFTITASATPAANSACLSYFIVN